jgi:hypothetical protein
MNNILTQFRVHMKRKRGNSSFKFYPGFLFTVLGLKTYRIKYVVSGINGGNRLSV